MELENIILSKVIQVRKSTGQMVSLIYGIYTQYKQCYEKWFMLRGSCIQERECKERKLRR
jgi:hypothetical protein